MTDKIDYTDYKQVITLAKHYSYENEVNLQRLLDGADAINAGIAKLKAEDKLSKKNAHKLQVELYGKLIKGQSF